MTTPIEEVQPQVEQLRQPAQPVPPGEQYFTSEQVERFRQQERDKLHLDLERQKTQLEELRTQVGSFAAEREAFQRAEAERQAAEEAAQRKAAEEEMSVRDLLKQRETEWENRLSQMEQERALERATLEKENQFVALQAYIQRRVREESEAQTIVPELLDLINGSNQEEVEQSIARLREKTTAIVTQMQNAVGAQPAPRGVSAAGYAAMGPLETNQELRPPTAEEIKGMNWEQYEAFRKKFNIGGGGGSTNGHGIFG